MIECGTVPTAVCGPFHSVLTACLCNFTRRKKWPVPPHTPHSPHTPTHTGGEGSTVLTLPAFRAHALSTTLASKGGCFQPRPLLLLWGEGEQGRLFNTHHVYSSETVCGALLFLLKSPFKKSFRVAKENVCFEIKLIWI